MPCQQIFILMIRYYIQFMIKRLLFVVLLISLALAVDNCQVQQSILNMFLAGQELRTVQLKSLIKGYNLEYKVDDPSVKIFSSYSVNNKLKLNLGEYKLKNYDIRSSNAAAGMGHAALLAQKASNQEVGIWTGVFVGDNSLPSINKLRQFKLPSNLSAKCFDFRLSSQSGNSGILNCQTIVNNPQTEVRKDLFCHISENDTELSLQTNCVVYPTKYSALERTTTVYRLDQQLYYLSSNKALKDDLQSINYIQIYHISKDNVIELKTQITSLQSTTPQFQIGRVVISNDNKIILSDTLNQRLIYLSYQDETVKVQREVQLSMKPLDIFYVSALNHIVVATQTAITEHQADDPSQVVFTYQVNIEDSNIYNVQVGQRLVMYLTNNGYINVYERNQYKMNYLLTRRLTDPSINYILSAQKNIIFQLSSEQIASAVVAPAFAEISGVETNKIIKISAASSKSSCSVDLNVTFISDIDRIIQKKDLGGSLLRVQSSQDLKVNLNEYYGGQNLQYSAKENENQQTNSRDFDVSLSHVDTYNFLPSFQKTQVSTIIKIDQKSFYFVGINSISENYAYIDLCSLQKDSIVCRQYTEKVNILANKKVISFIKGERTSSGQCYVAWGYKYSGVVKYLVIRPNPGLALFDYGTPIEINNILFTSYYQLLVSKGLRKVVLLTKNNIVSIDEQFFSKQQLLEVQYFYARQIYIDRSSQNIFYVKLPTKVAKFIILNNLSVQYLGVVYESDEFYMDKDWSLAFYEDKLMVQQNYQVCGKQKINYQACKGQQNIFYIVQQFYYNEIQRQYVRLNAQTVKSDNIANSLHYDHQNNLQTIISTQVSEQSDQTINTINTIKILKPFTSSIDNQYFQIQTKGDIKISQNWIYISQGNEYSVTHVNSDPVLNIQSHMPEQSFKADLNLTISVKNHDVQQSVNKLVQAVNFPVKIKEIPNDKVVKLPENANKAFVNLPVQTYFNGSISHYKLQCSMCNQEEINLKGPISFNNTIENIPGILDFVKKDNRVIAVANNRLYMMTTQGQILSYSQIRVQFGVCSNLQYNNYFDLLIYCSDETSQQILRYFVNNDKLVYADKYEMDEQSRVQHFDQMFAVTVQHSTFLFVLDNDQSRDDNHKQSVLKLFNVTKDFEFMGTWDSTTFGTQQKVYPINDFEVKDGLVIVTLGNFGIGYGNLNQKYLLINPGFIQLAAIPQVNAITLEDSFFKQVQILLPLSSNQDVNLFISTTNSFSFVFSLKRVNKNSYAFNGISQKYYRYGNLRLLNWQTVTRDSIYLSYYNKVTSQISIVYYNRTTNRNAFFTDSAKFKISQKLVQYHNAIVTDDNFLLTSELKDLKDGKMNVYFLYHSFILKLSYKESKKIEKIDIIASNYYNQANHTLKIKFNKPEPEPQPDPIKWYVIVIIVACIFIAVGAGYGVFLYKKKKRAEKNVSLLTEKQEENDSSAEKEGPNQSGLNRTSINAD